MCFCYRFSTETITAQFMENFRNTFPNCSIPIKIHLLKDHTVIWAKNTKVGFGLLGEVFTQSLIPCIEHRTYHSVHDPVKRLCLTIKKHLLSIALQNVAAIPPPTRKCDTAPVIMYIKITINFSNTHR